MPKTVTVRLPRLVAGRELARTLAGRLPADLAGMDVVLDCRELASGSSSFADELVHQVLAARGAGRLVVLGAPHDFASGLRAGAEAHGLRERLHLEDPVLTPAR